MKSPHKIIMLPGSPKFLYAPSGGRDSTKEYQDYEHLRPEDQPTALKLGLRTAIQRMFEPIKLPIGIIWVATNSQLEVDKNLLVSNVAKLRQDPSIYAICGINAIATHFDKHDIPTDPQSRGKPIRIPKIGSIDVSATIQPFLWKGSVSQGYGEFNYRLIRAINGLATREEMKSIFPPFSKTRHVPRRRHSSCLHSVLWNRINTSLRQHKSGSPICYLCFFSRFIVEAAANSAEKHDSVSRFNFRRLVRQQTVHSYVWPNWIYHLRRLGCEKNC